MAETVESVAEAVDPTKSDNENSFEQLDLSSEIKASLADMGYVKPTEVQQKVFEALLGASERDLVVQSKTGSGKTSAFGIPLVEHIEGGSGASGTPVALILTPTRELAHQVAAELQRIGERKKVSVLAVYGGVPMGRQISGLKAGIDIVVGTPGRLLDHIRRKNLDLSQIKHMVLDEADEMLSMGFWDDVTDLMRQSPKERQTMLFSATLPYQIAKAAAEFMVEPARIDLSGDDLTVQGIDNNIFNVLPDIPKPRQLLYLLETTQPESAIIFCNTRNETEMIAKYLTQSGFVAEALSGNFRQKERERVMERIKNKTMRFMIATDIASRGIDISHLTHVFNYSLPEFPEVYLHRVGRTGRAGRVGTAISLVDGKGLGTLSQLEKVFNIKFEEEMTLPPEAEVLQLRSQRIMKDLSEKASVAEVGQHVPVAKEIIEGEDAAQVVAFLVKSYFNQQVEDTRRSGGKTATNSSRRQQAEVASSTNEEGEGSPRRKRRRRRRRRGGENNNAAHGMETMDARDALAGSSPSNSNNNAPPAVALKDPSQPAPEGFARVRVNIGFDDGFKGRGAVAKKISALAGVNDGIVTEIESKREYAVLQAASDIAELLVERVDGAQIGKKIVSVSAFAPNS